jgi:maltooligosyltrehalose trehalohydrolase
MGGDPSVVPDPQARSTFENSKLDWVEVAHGEHARLLDTYRTLIRLRRSLPDLTDPRLARTRCEFDEDAGWFVVHRGETTVVVNFAPDAQTLPASGALRFSTDTAARLGSATITLPGHSAAILA